MLHQPTKKFTSLVSPWPFMLWGIDIVGPFPIARSQMKIILVAIDYFSKWVETKAYSEIKQDNLIRFLCR